MPPPPCHTGCAHQVTTSGGGGGGRGCCSSRAFVPAGRRAFPVHRRLWEGKNKEFLGRGLARGRLELAGCQGKRPAGLRGNSGQHNHGINTLFGAQGASSARRLRRSGLHRASLTNQRRKQGPRTCVLRYSHSAADEASTRRGCAAAGPLFPPRPICISMSH